MNRGKKRWKAAGGRRPGPRKRPVFDGKGREGGSGGSPRGDRDRGRQRQARTPASSRTSWRRAKEGAPFGGTCDHGSYRSGRSWTPGDRGHVQGAVEAGGSPSSEALPGATLTRGVRIQAIRRVLVVLVGCRSGKTHLPHCAPHARSGPACRDGVNGAVGGRGSLPWRSTGLTPGDRFAVDERVRGERGRTSKGARASLLRPRGRGSTLRRRRPGPGGAVVFNRKAASSGSDAEGRAARAVRRGGERRSAASRDHRVTEGVRGSNVR